MQNNSRITRTDVDHALARGKAMPILLTQRGVGKPAFVSLYPEELAAIEYFDSELIAWKDATCTASLNDVAYSMNLAQARITLPGIDGTGIKIAVVDSGIDTDHPDFVGRIIAYETFASDGSFYDTRGHGTHVASIAAGSGSKYKGVAPNASLLILKVFGASGTTTISTLYNAIGRARALGADIINLSLGLSLDYDVEHPLAILIESLVEAGTVVVCAAGNNGPGIGSIDLPASIPSAIAVGSIDKQMSIVSSSGRGPNAAGDPKPDFLAVGESVCAARSSVSAAPPADSLAYTLLSGTSMAAPFVSGLCALMLQANPALTPADIYAALRASAVDLEQPANTQGYGVVDAFRSLYQFAMRFPMTQLSTGLQAAVLGDYGISRMMDAGVIEVFSGEPPRYAHWAPTGQLLARITANGGTFIQGSPTNGLRVGRATQGKLTDNGEWELTGLNNGTAGWWRWKWYLNDPDTTDPYFPRMDGVVGDSLFLSSTTIVAGTAVPIDKFELTIEGAS